MGRRREEWVRRPAGSKTYHYDFTIDGRRFRGSCETVVKRDAEAFAKRLREEKWRVVKLGNAAASEPALPMDLNAACARWWNEVVVPRYLNPIDGEKPHRTEARRRRSVNARWYCREMLRVLGKATPVAHVDTAAAIHFVREMQQATTRRDKPLAPGTIMNMVICLVDILRRARLIWKEPAGEIDTREIKKMLPRAPKRKPKLSKAQAAALVDNAIAHMRPIVEFGIYTALRKENLLFLEWEDVDLEFRTGTVIVKGQDGGKAHSFPLIDAAVRLLVTYEPDTQKRTGRVWRFGTPACRCKRCLSVYGRMRKPIDNIDNAFDDAKIAAGVPWATLHSLRHASADWITGGDEAYLGYSQSLLGHERQETTKIYANVGMETLRRVANERLEFRSVGKAPNKPQRGRRASGQGGEK